MTDLIETVTTVPLTPSAGPSAFWEGVLQEAPHLDAKPTGAFTWATVLLLLGAFLSVGAGAFLITVGFGR